MDFCWMDAVALIILAAGGVVVYMKRRKPSEEIEELRGHISK